jgi:hypothetical protein
MVNKMILIVLLSLLVGLSNAKPIQESSDQSPDKAQKLSKYEKFRNRSGSFVLSKSYIVGQHKESIAYDVSAMTAWDMGSSSSERIYAARLGGLIVDFDDLGGLQQELDKIIHAVEKFADKQDATSMRYRALNGLEFDYFPNQPGSDNSQRAAQVTLHGRFLAGGSMNSVLELRTLISQAREKLISLGAK